MSDIIPITEQRAGPIGPPPGYGLLRRTWWWIDFLILVKIARLRFIAILAAVGGVIAYWDVLQAYYEKWTRPAAGAVAVAKSGTEYWCPMHPTIIRENAEKCPLCAMPLSARKVGAHAKDEPLPAGVVSRVQLTPYRVALAGIRTEAIAFRPLVKDITTVGFVEFDERRLARITTRATGKSRIERLFVNVTGQLVEAGEPLAELYSPDLVSTVQNLLDANKSGNAELKRMAEQRLRLWGIGDDQLGEIVKTGQPITHLIIRSPISGHVIKKYQVEGEYVEEGTKLYDIADLSTVWVEAQVYEEDLALLREGLSVSAIARAFPTREFQGRVDFVHPHLDSATRTLRVRFNVKNPGHELRPGMYCTVKLDVPTTQLDLFTNTTSANWRDDTAADIALQSLHSMLAQPSGVAPLLRSAVQQALAAQGQVLAVPERAVIDTGRRKFVYREADPHVFEGVEVELGPRSGGYYPIVRGLNLSDQVASAGSFLIDAETRLTAGVSSTYFGATGGPAGDRSSAATRASAVDDEEDTIRAAIGKLSAADRRMAEAQSFCAIQPDNRLGSMGTPLKVLVKGRAVFLCCAGCTKEALDNPDATLATVEQLKAKTKSAAAKEGRSP